MKSRTSRVTREQLSTHNPGGERNGCVFCEESSDELRARIAQRAYELYEQRGRREDHDLEDWFEAEHQILGHQD